MSKSLDSYERVPFRGSHYVEAEALDSAQAVIAGLRLDLAAAVQRHDHLRDSIQPTLDAKNAEIERLGHAAAELNARLQAYLDPAPSGPAEVAPPPGAPPEAEASAPAAAEPAAPPTD